ncbi:MAG TPA: hypothetical protein VFL47_02675 [Flavisolibacter sp.]|nr:hypothetical protein [Flavisolibacter sp.]
MARQVGAIKVVGTVDDLCFYRMEGEYFVRRKSSLTAKRFRKDKRFEGSRKSAGLLGKASALASRLYHRLPKEQKGRAVFRSLTGKIKLLLKEGWTEDRIEPWFEKTYLSQPPLAAAAGQKSTARKAAPPFFAARPKQRLPSLVQLPAPVQAAPFFRGNSRPRPQQPVKKRGSPTGAAETVCQKAAP